MNLKYRLDLAGFTWLMEQNFDTTHAYATLRDFEPLIEKAPFKDAHKMKILLDWTEVMLIEKIFTKRPNPK
jgi:hypothetical protein